MGWEILGTIAGGLLGGLASKKSKGGTETVDKSPWAPAQPWLLNNIATGQNLQNYYQQNPFNQQQIQAYNNLFGDLDNFRSRIAPGLFDKANQMMNGGYQRQSYARPGMAGYSQGGLLQQPAQAGSQQPVFGIPQAGGYSLLSMQSPVQQQPQPQQPAFDAKTVAQLVQEEFARREQERQRAEWNIS